MLSKVTSSIGQPYWRTRETSIISPYVRRSHGSEHVWAGGYADRARIWTSRAGGVSDDRVRQPISRRARSESTRQSDFSVRQRRAHELALYPEGAQGPFSG